jgi:undecaprenyl-diphosphatase
LPVSSSGHLILLGSRDKGFEVALHTGTALALVVALRGEVAEAVRELDAARVARVGLTFAPAAVLGLLFERPIERRLGGPRAVAVAQIAGGVGLMLADRHGAVGRSQADAGARDALLIGLAQACALVPGVSRNGATLTAARLLGFRRDAASRMSRHAALPIIGGATALKLARARRRGRPGGPLRRRRRSLTPQYAAGFAAAFASSLAAARLVPRIDRARTYTPFGIYRIALGLAFLAGSEGRGRQGRRQLGRKLPG